MENSIEVPQKLKTELPYDPAIPLLGIYLEKTMIPKLTCTPVFIAVFFTIARTRKQPKSLSTDEGIKKMWGVCVCVYEYYSSIKKNEIIQYHGLDGPRDSHTT